METKQNRNRNRKNGRYEHDDDAMCRCGRRYADHMADSPHDLDETECPRFRVAK